MRDIAEAASRDAENNPGLSEACTGWRIVGVTRSYEGHFVAARAAWRRRSPRSIRNGIATWPSASSNTSAYRQPYNWPRRCGRRGNPSRDDLAIGSVEQADRTGHVATMVYAHCVHAFLLVVRRDPVHAAIEVGAFAMLARKHAMPVWMAYADFLEFWVHWHDGHRDADLGAMRAGIAQAHEQQIALYAPLLETALAGAEAEACESTPRSPASITRSRRLGAPGSAGSKPRRTASAAKFY